MSGSDYVSVEEVARVCAELGIKNWAAQPPETVSSQEALVILQAMAVEGMEIPPEAFRRGLEVELEHGSRFQNANVTNNHPLLTGRIVLAHLKETLDYYERLEVAEIEGDLLKAAVSGKAEKVAMLYRKLLTARRELGQAECERLA